MPQVEVRRRGDTTHYALDGKILSNDDAVELRLGGNQGWIAVTITGLPATLRVTWTNEHDKTLQTTVPPEAQLRWP